MIAAARPIGTETPARVVELDRLLAQLSVNLINLPAERVDDAFRDALRLMGEGLALDCCSYSVVDGEAVTPQSEWRRPGTLPESALAPERARFPWTHAAVMRGTPCSFSCPSEMRRCSRFCLTLFSCPE